VGNYSYPRFYTQTFTEQNEGMIIDAIKYILLEKSGIARPILKNERLKDRMFGHYKIKQMTEKECNDNVGKGKFKEIPFAEAALM
jgi:hypothetical protein